MTDESSSSAPPLADHFLGESGENGTYFLELAASIVLQHLNRRGSDPDVAEASAETLESSAVPGLGSVLADLAAGVDFSSRRYLAHQQSDPSIPALAGAIAGLLANANNVTSESGPATTRIELEACDRLISMIGFPDSAIGGVGGSFCHLTSGGTVANIEALWAARELLYLPLSVQSAANLFDIVVKVGGKDLRRVAPWRLLGLAPTDKFDLLDRFHEQIGETVADATKGRRLRGLITAQNPNATGQLTAKSGSAETVEWALRSTSRNRWNGYGDALAVYPPVVLVAETAHYSIEKAVNLLGIGLDNVEVVPVDDNMRLDIKQLGHCLDRVEAEGRFPLAVVGIVGTTQEGAVDPVDQVLDLRSMRANESRSSFWVHVDGAWGAYLATLDSSSEGPLKQRVKDSVAAMSRADSVTVDPHKMGYLPYPCGAIAFRDDRVRWLLRQHAPYISDSAAANRLVAPIRAGDDVPKPLGSYTLEGSRPSFPGLALALSTSAMPLAPDGLGSIIGRTVELAEMLREKLDELAGKSYTLTSLQPDGGDTNLLVFGLRRSDGSELATGRHNARVLKIWRHFNPSKSGFRLSRTVYDTVHSSAVTRKRLAELLRIRSEPPPDSIAVLRFSILNPYLALGSDDEASRLFDELVRELKELL